MRGPIGLQAILMLVGAVAIFAVDTFTPLDIEITVLYAVLVIASASFLGRHGIQTVSCPCVLQTLLSYATYGTEASRGCAALATIWHRSHFWVPDLGLTGKKQT
jgi:hypothetical protein